MQCAVWGRMLCLLELTFNGAAGKKRESATEKRQRRQLNHKVHEQAFYVSRRSSPAGGQLCFPCPGVGRIVQLALLTYTHLLPTHLACSGLHPHQGASVSCIRHCVGCVCCRSGWVLASSCCVSCGWSTLWPASPRMSLTTMRGVGQCGRQSQSCWRPQERQQTVRQTADQLMSHLLMPGLATGSPLAACGPQGQQGHGRGLEASRSSTDSWCVDAVWMLCTQCAVEP